MNTITHTAIVPYSTDEMFRLVADIESYPQFLPWCGGARILSREGDTVVAEIDIAYKKVKKSFTTRNINTPASSIEMSLVSGPFHHLRGQWRFDELDTTACKITFEIDFEFSNKLVAMTLGPIFNRIADSFVDSFSLRAREHYGKR